MKRLVLLVVLAFAGAAAADPPTTHEVLTERPSGFWTSNRPAVGGRYRWRLLGIGIAIAGTMGLVTYRLLRRANEERRTLRR
jgi:hypothetical protein